MDEMTQKNAALVEETTAAAQSMASQATDLRGLVSFFKIDSTHHVSRPTHAPIPVVHHPARAAAKPAAHKPAAHKPVAHKPVAAKPAATGGGALRRAAAEADDEWKEF